MEIPPIANDFSKRNKSAFDSLLGWQASISAADAFRKYNESTSSMQAQILLEQSKVEKYLVKVQRELSIADDLRKQYEDLTASAKLFHDRESKTRAQIRERHALATVAIPRDMQRWIDDLTGGQSVRKAAELMNAWREPFGEVQRTFERYQDTLSSRAALSLLQSLERTSLKAALEDFRSGKAQMAVDRDLRTQAEEAVRELAAKASTQPTTEAALSQLLDAIGKISDTRLQKVLWFVVIPMLLMMVNAIMTPVADFYIKKALEGPKQEAHKEVKLAATQAVGDLRILRDHRFVSAKLLDVKMNPSARSPKVGELRFGQTVRILDRKKDFMLVVWSSTDGLTHVQGWVFSRHLNRFD